MGVAFQLIIIAVISSFASGYYNVDELICPSSVFCNPTILRALQTSKILEDPKQLFNYQLKFSEDKVLKNFYNLSEGERKNPLSLRLFLDENFEGCHDSEDCSKDLQKWEPTDWKKSPPVIDNIVDGNYSMWANVLNRQWKDLSYSVSETVRDYPDRTSMLYVSNGFIIPGGRFRELYYWDSYWIIKGLIATDMKETSKGMIQNFIDLARELGAVPHSNRKYFIRRIQPPMLISMIESYHQVTGDDNFIRDNIEWIEQELKFFISSRSVTLEKLGEKFTLFRYRVTNPWPRPEEFALDEKSAQKLPLTDKQKYFVNLKSAVESGWSFSSRWFIDSAGTNQGTLQNISTENIIPVDLNALMEKNFRLLSGWYRNIAKDEEKANLYQKRASEVLTAINNILWSDEQGIWLDYDMLNGKPRNYFYISNFFPLWTGSYDFDKNELSKHIIDYIKRNSLLRFAGGIPASLEYSDEQWDMPNCWAPLQAILIEGLDKIGTQEATRLAFQIANKWVASNYYGFVVDGAMYEKYSAYSMGKPGTGGEYPVQKGFGWTNGVILDLLNRFGKELAAPPINHPF